MTKKIINERQGQFDRNNLKDICEVTVDLSLPLEQRMKKFINEIKNPYMFRIGDSVVEVSWADTNNTLEDRMTELFRLQC